MDKAQLQNRISETAFTPGTLEKIAETQLTTAAILALITEAARLGYITGHHDTVESMYADPTETAADIVADMEFE